MTEQTRNITDAVIAKNQENRLTQMRIDGDMRKMQQVDKYRTILKSLHLYGTTQEEVAAQKEDPYFGSWFQEAEEGDIHVMHSILDHFEPLQIITNMGHNYRTKFSKDSAEIKLDFRPESKLPKLKFFLDGEKIGNSTLEGDERIALGKSYLYSSILRIAKELMLYFPLKKISFVVSCPEFGMNVQKFEVLQEQVKFFLAAEIGDNFNEIFEDKVF